MTNIDPNEKYVLDIAIKNDEINEVIKKWIKIEPITDKLENPDQCLVFKIKFQPHKPFKCMGVFIVKKLNHGGQWK